MYASNQPRWQSLLYLSSALTSTAFVWALATSSPARAQTPVPPNPALPYVVQQQGTNGNPGNDADPYQGTTNGQPGNAPSADINLLFPGNFTAIGASKSPLIQLSTIGGNGGRGGTAANVETGNGGDGAGRLGHDGRQRRRERRAGTADHIVAVMAATAAAAPTRAISQPPSMKPSPLPTSPSSSATTALARLCRSSPRAAAAATAGLPAIQGRAAFQALAVRPAPSP